MTPKPLRWALKMMFDQLKFTKRAYFPTLIFQIDLPNPEAFNAELLSTI